MNEWMKIKSNFGNSIYFVILCIRHVKKIANVHFYITVPSNSFKFSTLECGFALTFNIINILLKWSLGNICGSTFSSCLMILKLPTYNLLRKLIFEDNMTFEVIICVSYSVLHPDCYFLFCTWLLILCE